MVGKKTKKLVDYDDDDDLSDLEPAGTKVEGNKQIQCKLFIVTFFITAKFFTTSIVFAQMYQFSLNLNSSQQKFSLTSNYLGDKQCR